MKTLPEKIKFRVIQPHIDRGLPNESEACPVYLALRQALGNIPISVGRMFIKIAGVWFEADEKLHRFLLSVDRLEKVSPASFILSKRNERLNNYATRHSK